MPSTPTRCPWCGSDPLYTAYHDTEWGVPCHDERALFDIQLDDRSLFLDRWRATSG